MRKSISQILKEVSQIKDVEERKQALVANDSVAIRTLLKLCYDQTIEWNLPLGPAPYKPCEVLDQEGRLYQETRRMYLFLKGQGSPVEGNDGPSRIKRERLFIEMLETLDPQDASLILSIKDRKMPYKGISKSFVGKVYPGLLADVENVQA